MKIFYSVFLCIACCVQATAQDTLMTFQGVVPVEQKKSVLYSKALEWVGQTYRSAKDVIQTQDPEGGTIVIKGSFKYIQLIPLTKFEVYMHYTGTLSFKDGKYRYEFTYFTPVSANTNYPPMTSGDEPNKTYVNGFGKRGWKKTQESIHENIEPLILSLENHMKSAKTENW